MAENKKILRIAKGELRDNAVWFMRQAGRYLPDYEKLKGGRTFIQVLSDPQSIFDISLLPLKYMEVDAVVVFTDILLPLTKMGYRVSYENGISVTGSKEEGTDLYEPLSLALGRISESFSGKTLIGVVGGPFTTLSYVYDRGEVGYPRTKEAIASGNVGILRELTERIIEFAQLQAKSGADVIQIFESWLGSVPGGFYNRHLEENEVYFVEKVKEIGKPVIFFSEGTSHLEEKIVQLSADVYSVDWRTDLDKFHNICPDCVLQGNLDPYILGAGEKYLTGEVARIMKSGKKFRGHIFNLGHGVPPWADWRKLEYVSREVRNFER